jgi:hypothetical protein
MPSYQIKFVGGVERSPRNIVCVDDRQALSWASGLLEQHLGAEVSHDGRQVGWVTTADNQDGVGIIFGRG